MVAGHRLIFYDVGDHFGHGFERGRQVFGEAEHFLLQSIFNIELAVLGVLVLSHEGVQHSVAAVVDENDAVDVSDARI